MDELRNNMKHGVANEFIKNKDIFTLLGDENRIKIICLLLDSPSGEMNVDEIGRYIYLSRPAISHHLKMLKDFGILKYREESRYNYYYLNKENDTWIKLYNFFVKVDELVKKVNDKDE